MVSRPRIKREEFVETVSQFQAYLTSNDKLRWTEEIPSEFFGADYEEYVDVDIVSAKNSMSVWGDEIHGDYYKKSKAKLEACELLKIDALPMPEAFMDRFKDWVVGHCSKEWKSFLNARRQKKLKSNRSKKQVTLASDVYYKLANFRKDLNLSIDEAVAALLDGHQDGNTDIASKANITNSYEYVAAQQRILELKDMHPDSYYISDVKSLKAKSEAFLKTKPGEQMLRNNKHDKAYQLEEIERWAKA
jgi:predicted CopG family antitoxin